MTTATHRFSWSVIVLWIPWLAGAAFLFWILFINVPLGQSVKRSCIGTACSRGVHLNDQPWTASIVNPPGAQVLKVHFVVQAEHPFTSTTIILSQHKDFSDPFSLAPSVAQAADGWTVLDGEVSLPAEQNVKKWFVQLETKPKKFTVKSWNMEFELNHSYVNRLHSWWEQTRS